MRIRSTTTWLLSTSLVAFAADLSIDFNQTCFQGFNNTSILNYHNQNTGCSGQGYMFSWTTTSPNVAVLNIGLIRQDDSQNIQTALGTTDTNKNTQQLADQDKFIVNYVNAGGSLTLGHELLEKLFGYMNRTFFFQVEWNVMTSGTGEKPERDVSDQYTYNYTYSYSQPWAIADSEEAAMQVLHTSPSLIATGTSVFPPGSTSVATGTPIASNPAAKASTSSIFTGPASNPSSTTTTITTPNSNHKSSKLSTGAIVGIAIGVFVAVALIIAAVGCFCFRRRRRRSKTGMHHGDRSRQVQSTNNLVAEKEARAGIRDDSPNSPYLGQSMHHAAQHPLNRGIIMSGMNESGVDMGVGQAADRGCGNGSLHAGPHYNDGGNRSSVVYSPLGSAASNTATPTIAAAAAAGGSSSSSSGSPTHKHPPSSMSIREGTSMMGSPIPCASSQQERAFPPYTDHPASPPAPGTAVSGTPTHQQLPPGYSHDHHHHHDVVDGANLVHQEQFNGSSAQHSPGPGTAVTGDEPLPISPGSINESAGGGGSSSSSSSSSGGTSQLRPAAFGRPETPSGISGQYAHLVEDGMTDDEIRRLEEEERALDEAIEQAGAGAGAGARGR